ncbi:MAG: methionyl aminopeptidase, partial [Lentisphaeria bacterium]|nr:methionyl aminopeptidase [Lentisphaeria bacterium]
MSRNQNVHTPEEIIRIRRAAAITAEVRDRIAESIRPGMTTMDVDMLAGELIRGSGGKSAFFNYHGYPGNICISVNEEVVHGIGSPTRVIGEKDIVSIDVGVEFDGAMGDTAVTVSMDPEPSADIRRLLEGTRKALFKGIDAARCGRRVGDISRAVELA